ncbi:DUF4382 domain-containing protein [Caldimonas tepidiphila]|uniref:DUF4382 domain-containing protein n=1 Tax=Caldimonas tepidiphila TaxID=2315841 RepID=UPI000E5B37C7|nr:DUF4382 domain-containing protein [Caldimonas tepidiphila]
MTKISRLALAGTTLAATTAVLSACGGGGGSGGGEGTLRMALTDAPACGFEEVNVTVERVRVHQSGSANEGAAGWQEIVLSTPKRVNLLELQNGVLEELGSTRLPAGRYTQLRLVLAADGAAVNGRPAHSVKPVNGTEMVLETPSALQSGLKMNADIEVAPNQVADFVLDFDACKSVVSRGNSGRYNLKPVVSILPRVTSPGLAVQGRVAAPLGGTATVSLQRNGVVVRSTVAMADNPATPENEAGRFLLSPVPAGSYELVVGAEGRVTAVLTGVPVSEGAVTSVSPGGFAIDLPAATMRTVSGTVRTSGTTAIPLATVSALQSLGSTRVEVQARTVDGDTGAYGLTLPAEAPVRAAYSATASGFTFAPDAAAAGRYTLEASVPGKDTQSQPVDLRSGNVTAAPFSFAP